MKYISLMMLFIVMFVQLSAQTDRQLKKLEKEKEVKSLIESKQYRFVAQKVIPLSGASISLTSEYDLVVDSIKIKAFLPFFGRAYHVDYASGEGGIKFEDDAEEYNADFDEKRKQYKIQMKVKTQKDVFIIHLDAGVSGYASLQISSNNKQSISYFGIIDQLESISPEKIISQE